MPTKATFAEGIARLARDLTPRLGVSEAAEKSISEAPNIKVIFSHGRYSRPLNSGEANWLRTPLRRRDPVDKQLCPNLAAVECLSPNPSLYTELCHTNPSHPAECFLRPSDNTGALRGEKAPKQKAQTARHKVHCPLSVFARN